MNNTQTIEHITKLKNNFVSEMKKKYEDAKTGVGLDDLPNFLLARKFEYSEDFETEKLYRNEEGIDVISHHLKVLNDFQIKIDEIKKQNTIVRDFTYTSASVDTDYGEEDGEISHYQIQYEYFVLISEFDGKDVGNYAKKHIANYLKDVLFEGTGASHKKSVSCADINALLDGDVTVETLRKIKYELCEVL